MPIENLDRQYIESIVKGNKVVVVCGAGVSTPSGIPDYSSMDGIIVDGVQYNPREILSLSFIERHPDTYNEWHKILTDCNMG